MGNVHKGIPRHLAIRLRDKYGLRNFVETGTGQGRTAGWALEQFECVVTIELQPAKWKKALPRCRSDKSIVLCGDSRELLAGALIWCKTPALIWLDAHWSSDLGYACPDNGECPVLVELDIINADGQAHVIMIDDAHQFQQPPNGDWPDLGTMLLNLPVPNVHWIEDDVIVSVPWRGWKT